MVFKIPVRKFKFATDRNDTTERDGYYQEDVLEFNARDSALVLMDVWESHPTAGFIERAQNCRNHFIANCVLAAHLKGILVIHASHGQKESTALPASADDLFLSPDLNSADWFKVLHEKGIRNVFYTGFASNWCLLFRPEGIVETSRQKINTILIRDAAVGYETPETLGAEWAHFTAINIVDAQFGGSITTHDWIMSLNDRSEKKADCAEASILGKEWEKPFEMLRTKWGNIPTSVSTGEISSVQLSRSSDQELLSFWETKQKQNLDHEGFEVRGWYHAIYDALVKGKRIIDLGCGLGLDCVRFAELGAHVVFCDIDQNNLSIVRRICRLKGIEERTEFIYLKDFESFSELRGKFDILFACGSMHHAPFSVIQKEVAAIVPHLNSDARWLQLAYPKSRWQKEGCLPFDQWGEKTNAGTPWTEWYDTEKLNLLLGPHGFRQVYSTEFFHNQFVWFDWIRSA